MSIQTYAELVTAAQTWLHRADLASVVPDFVSGAEDRINREVKAREKETVLAVTIASNGTAALPSDYGMLKHAYLGGVAPVVWLQRKSVEFIYSRYPTRSADSTPGFIAREGSNFIFGPFPATTGDVVNGIYYKDFAALSSTVNGLFTASPLLYLYAALSEAEPYMKNDKRIAVWEAKYRQIKDRVEGDTDSESWSGSGLTMTVA